MSLEDSRRPHTFYHQMNRKRKARHVDDFLKGPETHCEWMVFFEKKKMQQNKYITL